VDIKRRELRRESDKLVRNHLYLKLSKAKENYRKEQQDGRSNIANSALGHLRSTYFAVKQLALEVLDKQRSQQDKEFSITLWASSSVILSDKHLRTGFSAPLILIERLSLEP
jgi:hypothetical protein